MKLLISLFDYTGNWSRPYRENGWHVIQVDIKDGHDVFQWAYDKVQLRGVTEIGMLVAMPCTCYALSGNAHKETRKLNGEFELSQRMMLQVRKISTFFKATGKLKFWVLENPMTDIHTHNPWLGKPKQKFNPCDFAGYAPVPDKDRYNKQTWLFGFFNRMEPKRLEPLSKDSPVWARLGGKSERTKELRSITPLGFAYAFYEANN